MSTLIDQLHTALKTHGYSLTKSRIDVFNALQNTGPQTMQELTTACTPSVDRASVYRIVALFEKLDIIHRIQIGWKYKLELSGTFSYHHHHISCLKCGRVEAIDEDTIIEGRLLHIARNNNFLVKDHQLEINGICANCQTKIS